MKAFKHSELTSTGDLQWRRELSTCDVDLTGPGQSGETFLTGPGQSGEALLRKPVPLLTKWWLAVQLAPWPWQRCCQRRCS